MKKLKIIIYLCAFLLFVGAFFTLSFTHEDCTDLMCRLSGRGKGAVERLEKKYGIRITSSSTGAIPELWRMPPANGSAEYLPAEYLCRYTQVLDKELRKYPLALLNQYLKTIYLMQSIHLYGVDYRGTQLGNAVYLTGGPRVMAIAMAILQI